MKMIEPSVEILTPLDGKAILKHIEQCGRVCYKSEDKTTDTSYENFIRGIIKRGHESVIEHFSVTVKFICDRGVSHEIVRHRIASYSQESTRYCNYDNEKFGKEITIIKPSFLNFEKRDSPYGSYYSDMKTQVWYGAMCEAENHYFNMLKAGATPQEARSILPNSLKTEVIMTANLREWRHFFKLRCSSAAHPDMRIIACMLLEKMKAEIPVIFDDNGEIL